MTEPTSEEVLAFISATFRSAWALELLCLLRTEPRRAWLPEELVRALHASKLVVRHGVGALAAVGLVTVGTDGRVSYEAPAHLEPLVSAVEQLYRTAPDAARRAVARGNSQSLTAFADAFRLRSDD